MINFGTEQLGEGMDSASIYKSSGDLPKDFPRLIQFPKYEFP